MEQYKACPQCGNNVTPRKGKGYPKTYCSKRCQVRAAGERRRLKPEDRAKAAARTKQWREQNPKRSREAIKRLWQLNGERYLLTQKEWKQRNLERYRKVQRDASARRYGRMSGVGVSVRDWIKLVNRYNNCCAYCGIHSNKLQQDHIIPLSRGGKHTIGNVLPACGSCNSSKNDSMLFEWKIKTDKLFF